MGPPGEPYVSVELERSPAGCLVVRVAGDLDAVSAADVEARLAEGVGESVEPVVLDLTAVEFIDSSGIRVILGAMQHRGGPEQFVLVSPRSGTARKAIEIVGLARVATIVESADEAVARIAR